MQTFKWPTTVDATSSGGQIYATIVLIQVSGTTKHILRMLVILVDKLIGINPLRSLVMYKIELHIDLVEMFIMIVIVFNRVEQHILLETLLVLHGMLMPKNCGLQKMVHGFIVEILEMEVIATIQAQKHKVHLLPMIMEIYLKLPILTLSGTQLWTSNSRN